MSMARKLNRTETKLLNAYREHPMYRCYAELKRYSETPPIAAIAPYYLTYWFIHKKNPQIPFKKWRYKFTSKHTEINLRVSVSNDDRVHYYQACNYYLFQELCIWWTNIENSQPTIYLHNQMLCEALYARCRHQVVKQEWLRIGTRPSGMGYTQEGIYQIYQQLDGIFDFTAFPFPIYAKTMNHIDDLMYYFYDKQDDNVRKAKRYIQKMLTEQDVEEYKERMFMGEDGAGKSIMPIEWHERIAEWLEKMIGKNLFVSKYVEGNPDPYYPGSSVRLSEIDKAIEYFDEKERIYPEDLQPYLAFVEWYIQKVCCERICADMQPKVLSFCKRIFLEI